jgi:hypothetical protein
MRKVLAIVDTRDGRQVDNPSSELRMAISVSALHKHWAKLEDEHQDLVVGIEEAGIDPGRLSTLRERQASLLLEIGAVVAQIRDAPATTLEDFLALLDVALDHETDLAGDIGVYGPKDFPMITRVLRGLAQRAPGFEFNSLKRWLSSPEEYRHVIGDPATEKRDSSEPIGFCKS